MDSSVGRAKDFYPATSGSNPAPSKSKFTEHLQHIGCKFVIDDHSIVGLYVTSFSYCSYTEYWSVVYFDQLSVGLMILISDPPKHLVVKMTFLEILQKRLKTTEKSSSTSFQVLQVEIHNIGL